MREARYQNRALPGATAQLSASRSNAARDRLQKAQLLWSQAPSLQQNPEYPAPLTIQRIKGTSTSAFTCLSAFHHHDSPCTGHVFKFRTINKDRNCAEHFSLLSRCCGCPPSCRPTTDLLPHAPCLPRYRLRTRVCFSFMTSSASVAGAPQLQPANPWWACRPRAPTCKLVGSG